MDCFAKIQTGRKPFFNSSNKSKEVVSCLKHLHFYLARSAAECRWTLFYEALNLYSYLVTGLHHQGGLSGTLLASATKQLHRIHELSYCQLAREFPLGQDEIKTDQYFHQSKTVQLVEPMLQPIVMHLRNLESRR
jgi:hypothetical protein